MTNMKKIKPKIPQNPIQASRQLIDGMTQGGSIKNRSFELSGFLKVQQAYFEIISLFLTD